MLTRIFADLSILELEYQGAASHSSRASDHHSLAQDAEAERKNDTEVQTLIKALDAEIRMAQRETPVMDHSMGADKAVKNRQTAAAAVSPAHMGVEAVYCSASARLLGDSHRGDGPHDDVGERGRAVDAAEEMDAGSDPRDGTLSTIWEQSEDSRSDQGLERFIRGKVEPDQKRLQVQERAKRLMQFSDDRAENDAGANGQSLATEDEDENEESALLNAALHDEGWVPDSLKEHHQEDSDEDIFRSGRKEPNDSFQIGEAQCEKGLLEEENQKQSGGLVALKETVATSLSILRNDLLPTKAAKGSQEGSPALKALDSACEPAGPRRVDSARGSDQSGRTGFALLKNSLSILREDLGLGSR